MSRPLLLAAGAGLGIALGVLGLLGTPGDAGGELAGDVAARVNGRPVRMEEYRRTLAGVAADRRAGADAADRRRVLDRMIDEELLVQRALELGLAQQDARVRRDLVAAVVDAVVTEADATEPTDAELEAFYRAHADLFSRPGRVHARQVWLRVTDAQDESRAAERAAEAVRRLRAGESIRDVRRALGDGEAAPLPDQLLPAAKLLDYLGPTCARAALALPPGAVSDPVRSGTGYHVLQVVAREDAWLPPFAGVAADVSAEYRRRAGDRALRAYLDDLRQRAEVAVAPELTE
jgi:parvulin-like peptidyl-prolyl isomerase